MNINNEFISDYRQKYDIFDQGGSRNSDVFFVVGKDKSESGSRCQGYYHMSTLGALEYIMVYILVVLL